MEITSSDYRNFADILDAWSLGKPIEICHAENWLLTEVKPIFVNRNYYRIAPWKLPDPPARKNWQRPDSWKEGDLPQGYRPLLRNEKREVGDEYEDENDRWITLHDFQLSGMDRTAGPYSCKTRTQRPLPKEPVEVPWTAEDVPALFVLRHKNCLSIVYHPMQVGPSGINIKHDLHLQSCTWDLLQQWWEYSTDKITWKPCSTTK